MLKELSEIRKIMYKQNENVNKKREILKRSQKEFFLKHSFYNFYLFFDTLILTSKGNYLG